MSARRLSRATARNIKQNLMFAFLYNGFGASRGGLSPMIAGHEPVVGDHHCEGSPAQVVSQLPGLSPEDYAAKTSGDGGHDGHGGHGGTTAGSE